MIINNVVASRSLVETLMKIRAAISLSVCTLAVLPGEVMAAQDNDIVVTATKEETPRFNAPLSVDVVEGVGIERRHLENLSDIAQQLPNVYFSDLTRSNPSITIRGLGSSDDESDSLSSAVLIDGVPIYGMALGQLFDLQQIEVLRGPQSTLYGQDSMGGIVALRTRDPGFVWGGDFQADHGTGNRNRLMGGIDVPLGASTAIRLSGGYEKADGFIHNITLGRRDTGGWRNVFGRLKLLHVDRAGGEWRLAVSHVDMDGGNDFFADAALARRHRSDANEAGVNDQSYRLVTGQYDRDLGGGTHLAIVAGGNETKWRYFQPASVFGGPTGFDQRTRQYSVEIRLNGSAGSLDWLGGAYLGAIRRRAPYLFDLRPYLYSYTDAHVRGETAALFGELGWRFAPSWRISGALRVEHDRRRLDWISDQRGLFDGDGDGVPETSYAGVDRLDNVRADDMVTLPRLRLEYRPDERNFGWITLARGFKAAGFNQYGFTGEVAGTPYRAETGDYAEIGYRLRGTNDRWELGAIGFYTKLRDQQVVVTQPTGDSQTTNAGRSHNLGFELTGRLRPATPLQLSAWFGYVEAEYDRYVNNGIDLAGRQFASTPRTNFGGSARWTPVAELDAGISVGRFGKSNLYPNASVPNPARCRRVGPSRALHHRNMG